MVTIIQVQAANHSIPSLQNSWCCPEISGLACHSTPEMLPVPTSRGEVQAQQSALLAFLLSTPLANWRSTDTAEILIYSELPLLWQSPFLPLLMKVINVHFYPSISMHTSNTGQQSPCAIVKNESWLSAHCVLSALWTALQDHLTRILWWPLLVSQFYRWANRNLKSQNKLYICFLKNRESRNQTQVVCKARNIDTEGSQCLHGLSPNWRQGVHSFPWERQLSEGVERSAVQTALPHGVFRY